MTNIRLCVFFEIGGKMGFKEMRYFQNSEDKSKVMTSTLDLAVMKRKGWREISAAQYSRIRYLSKQ